MRLVPCAATGTCSTPSRTRGRLRPAGGCRGEHPTRAAGLAPTGRRRPHRHPRPAGRAARPRARCPPTWSTASTPRIAAEQPHRARGAVVVPLAPRRPRLARGRPGRARRSLRSPSAVPRCCRHRPRRRRRGPRRRPARQRLGLGGRAEQRCLGRVRSGHTPGDRQDRAAKRTRRRVACTASGTAYTDARPSQAGDRLLDRPRSPDGAGRRRVARASGRSPREQGCAPASPRSGSRPGRRWPATSAPSRARRRSWPW